MSAPPIRVALVEDQHRTREGLALLVGGATGFEVAGQFDRVEALLQHGSPPDVLLLDIGLPGMSGIDGVRCLRARWPDLRILILSVHGDDDSVFAAICAGACGYLLKDTPPDRLLEAIAQVHGGGAVMSPGISRKVLTMFQRIAPPRGEAHDLTEREVDVLRQLSEGLAYKQIAAALQVSIDTVRYHLRNIYGKLHVHSKSEAVLAALRRGIVR